MTNALVDVFRSPGADSSRRNVCSLCGQSYNTKDKLSAHLFSKHAVQTRITCHGCPKSFTRKDVMMLHYRRVHLGQTGSQKSVGQSSVVSVDAFAATNTLSEGFTDSADIA